tara:strand:+ start:5998 stop:6411 length:414 start_codon:yes stop_codon:yes gene_type:complete
MKLIYEVFDLVKSSKNVDDKINVLRKNETWALKDVLRGTYDPKVKWNVPSGKPPYEPNQGHNAPANLLKQNKQFKYFVRGLDGDKLLKPRREMLYIKLLESVHPKDAEIVINMTSKKSITGISKSLVRKAFPNLIPE